MLFLWCGRMNEKQKNQSTEIKDKRSIMDGAEGWAEGKTYDYYYHINLVEAKMEKMYNHMEGTQEIFVEWKLIFQ